MIRYALALSIATACQSCERPPPAPSTPDAGPPVGCAEMCARLETWGCKTGAEVCDSFDDAGECRGTMPCATACELAPQAYPSASCVVELAPLTGDECGEVERWCR